SVCGGVKPVKKKKVGKKLQISLGGKPSVKEEEESTEEKGEEPDKDKKEPDEKTPDKDKKKPDEALASWLSGEGDEDLGVWMGDDPKKASRKRKDKESKETKPTLKGADGSTDALRKWLSGEDDSLEAWLGKDMKPVSKAGKSPVGKELVEREKFLEAKERALDEKEEDMKVETEELKKTLNEAIKKIDAGDFDPISVLEETAKLNKDLQKEIRKRKKLEEEIQQVKKGSIAVIKYIKAQEMQKKGGAASSLKKKLDSEVSTRGKLEIDLKKSEELVASLKVDLEKGMESMSDDAKDLKKQEIELKEMKASIEAKEEVLKTQEKKIQQQLKNGSSSSEANVELQQRLAAELSAKEQEFIKSEGELKQKIIELEEKLHEHEIDDKLQKDRNELTGKSDAEINKDLEKKMRELQIKEKSLIVREDEIKRLKEELKSKEGEIKTLKEPLAYKEEEMLRREEDLVYREQLLIEERRKVEEAMRESGSMESHEMKKKLEELQMQINRKEEEIRTKEEYLRSKAEDLKIREKGLIEEEIDAREEERKIELKIDKVKTGDRRLDDLLLGGIPFGSNILVHGPPFTGKEVTINCFVAEGLAKGIPALYVITDKLPSEIREDMMYIVSGFEEYERLGLVKFVDAYSRSIGVEDVEENVTYVDDPTDHESIMKAVDDTAKELLKKHKYYRLAFRSISTLIAYMDSASAFKFLQPFCGKRKRERSVAMYAIEKGMHDEQDILMIGSVMEGSIEYKVEQLKTYLSIQGIGDVQSRGWIDYTYSKQALAIGSFSLDHIR
ncbi:MAG: hypothetical protein KAX31_06605, partial [Thermoplasmata archaeon]|nr:hypothetical protein [Thermoplasmata archaeon]